jgi:hypothetical protein
MGKIKGTSRAMPSSPKVSPEDRQVLAEEFQALYGSAPPSRLSLDIVRLANAYRQQERSHGGLKSSAKRRLLLHAVPVRTMEEARHKSGPCLRPGTELLREWQGVSYSVQIIQEGVVFEGKTYGSLSEVARRITGQVCSGPRFFGLLSPRVVPADEN